jgi:hypothetical protein
VWPSKIKTPLRNARQKFSVFSPAVGVILERAEVSCDGVVRVVVASLVKIRPWRRDLEALGFVGEKMRTFGGRVGSAPWGVVGVDIVEFFRLSCLDSTLMSAVVLCFSFLLRSFTRTYVDDLRLISSRYQDFKTGLSAHVMLRQHEYMYELNVTANLSCRERSC